MFRFMFDSLLCINKLSDGRHATTDCKNYSLLLNLANNLHLGVSLRNY